MTATLTEILAEVARERVAERREQREIDAAWEAVEAARAEEGRS